MLMLTGLKAMFLIIWSSCIYSSWVEHTGLIFFFQAAVYPKIIRFHSPLPLFRRQKKVYNYFFGKFNL